MLSAGIFALIVGIAFEFMAVATALPEAARELGGLGLYPWALTGFLGAAMFANGIAGEICDRIGPRCPCCGGTSFAAGLMISGLSQSMPMLIAGRVVQCRSRLHDRGGVRRDRPVLPRGRPAPRDDPDLDRLGRAVGHRTVHRRRPDRVRSWRWAFLSLVPLLPIPLLAVLPGRHRADRRPPAGPGPARGGDGHRCWAAPVGRAAGGGLVLGRGRGRSVVGLALVILAALRLFPAGVEVHARSAIGRDLPRVTAGGFFGCEAYVPLMLVEHRGPPHDGRAVRGHDGHRMGYRFLDPRPSGISGCTHDAGPPGRRVHHDRRGDDGVAAIATEEVTLPAWLSGLGLLVGGLGMGLGMASNSVLLFDYSPVEDRGANSALIEMSDSLGGLLVIGTAGVIYALWRDTLTERAVRLVFALARWSWRWRSWSGTGFARRIPIWHVQDPANGERRGRPLLRTADAGVATVAR